MTVLDIGSGRLSIFYSSESINYAIWEVKKNFHRPGGIMNVETNEPLSFFLIYQGW